jgi:hypothetical protein
VRASVPTSTVDNTYEVFPKGVYDGNLSGAQQRDVNGDGSWITLKLSVSDITPKEGTADPGRTAFNSDLTLKTDGVDLFEVENFNSRDVPFGIRRSAGLLAGLAEGLGVAARENGIVSVDLAAVVTALVDSQFDGERVGFEVSHYTPKGGEARDQYNRFGPAS